MRSKGHLSLVSSREIPKRGVEAPSKAPAPAQEKDKATISAGSLVDGEIIIFAGGVRYSAKIWDTEKFTHELREATRRGHNPAEAAKWLIELAVSKLNPSDDPPDEITAKTQYLDPIERALMMSSRPVPKLGYGEELKWEKLFGKSRSS